MSNFSSKIKKLRIENGLTQKQIAESLNVSQNAIYNWENGKREPNLDMIKQIAKYFDFPLYLLLDDNYELGDIALEKKRARAIGDTEMTEPPGPFTVPLSQYNNEDDSIYIDPYLQALYEKAMQKALNREELTDEEEQVLIGIPGKLRKKGNDPLSYENSYSFAGSEEEFNKLQEERPIELEKKNTNSIHKYDATIIHHNLSSETIENLTEISRIYKKIENDDKLTENELQIFKDYNQRQEIAMKRLKETLRTMQEKMRPLIELQSAYDKLNEVGQAEAAKRIEELTEIPRYTKQDDPPEE